ncbi:MAG: rubredoxin [Desulfobulbaceae bacterium]|nr:MAG: rubredoxin [Desulfobulbaceae bacterium]
MADPKDLHQCQISNCGFVYNQQKQHRKIKEPQGTKFEALPLHWKCPVGGASKENYQPMAGPGSVAEENG